MRDMEEVLELWCVYRGSMRRDGCDMRNEVYGRKGEEKKRKKEDEEKADITTQAR